MAQAVMLIVDTVVKKTEQQLSDSSKTLQVGRHEHALQPCVYKCRVSNLFSCSRITPVHNSELCWVL